MATQIKSWQIVDGALKPIETTLKEQGKSEAYDLESWIASDSSVIGPDLRVIGRQVRTASGPLDLLGIDRTGDLVVIEIKRDLLPRQALAPVPWGFLL
jgi:RecB family endonuclease NucS